MKTKINYSWDLTKFCEDENDFNKLFNQLEKLAQNIPTFEGKLNNKVELKKFFELEEELEKISEKLGIYSTCSLAVDQSNTKFIGLRQKLSDLGAKIGALSAFSTPEILGQTDEWFDQMIAEKSLLPWHFNLKQLKTQKAHVLTKEQEVVLSVLSPTFGSAHNIFNSCSVVDVDLGEVEDSLGKKHKLTRTNYSKLMQNVDEVLRHNALNRFYEVYGKYVNTLSSTLIAQAQSNVCLSKLYKYKSVLDESFAGDNIDRTFYDSLINGALKFTKQNQEYNNLIAQLIKKQYSIKNLTEYDLGLPVGKKPEDVSFEEMLEVTKKSLSILGPNYVNMVQNSINQRWVDVLPRKNKESGAWTLEYKYGTPVVMLNFEGELDDVFAHEIGHALRFVECAKNNFPSGVGSSIFIEETFSTVNQTLFARYLIDNAKTKEEKIYHLVEYLSTMFSYVVGASIDSLCEDEIYKRIENNLPISKDVILDFEKQQYEKILNTVVKKRHQTLRSITMPHYYFEAYYVWQYACGQLNANFIVNKIEQHKGFVEKYFEFMKAGSMYPLDMLKIVGIDYAKNDVFVEFEKEINKRLAQLKELLKN